MFRCLINALNPWYKPPVEVIEEFPDLPPLGTAESEEIDMTTIKGYIFTQDEIVEIVGHMASGKKVNALKAVRSATGMGLKEAKGLVDAGYFNPGPPLSSQENFE